MSNNMLLLYLELMNDEVMYLWFDNQVCYSRFGDCNSVDAMVRFRLAKEVNIEWLIKEVLGE